MIGGPLRSEAGVGLLLFGGADGGQSEADGEAEEVKGPTRAEVEVSGHGGEEGVPAGEPEVGRVSGISGHGDC